jgi:hypothetical protein
VYSTIDVGNACAPCDAPVAACADDTKPTIACAERPELPEPLIDFTNAI